jgi:hypothetical protein
MEKNQLKNTVITVFSVIALLCVLSIIPEFSVGSFKIKRIPIFSFLLSKPVVSDSPQTLPQQDSLKQVASLSTSCPEQMVCWENFDTTGRNLMILRQAIAEIQTGKKCRMAFFGDSFIEGDMMLAYFRDTLQQVYGGKQVGFVPITSPVARNRPTIAHSYSGWITTTILDTKGTARFPYGIAGAVYLPKQNASVKYHIHPLFALPTLSDFSTARLFYHALKPTIVKLTADNTTQLLSLSTSSAPVSVQSFSQPHLHSLQLEFPYPTTDSLAIFGLSLEGDRGIYIDNFAMRGNSGTSLVKISQNMLQSIDSLQQYGLIVLQFGLNVSSGTKNGLLQYGKDMEKVVEYMKKAFPNSAILIMGVSDRAAKNAVGNLETIPQIAILKEMQRATAQKYATLFWDTQAAMGGNNSIIEWQAKRWANSDFTHLSFQGGRELAKRFSTAFFFAIHSSL